MRITPLLFVSSEIGYKPLNEGIVLFLLGQLDCQRTNREPSRRCAKSCNPETGCDNPADECLCDGDCGYSCVQKGL